MHHSTIRRLAAVFIAAIIALTSGCKTGAPVSTALAAVHQSYREDFAGFQMPLNPGHAPAGDFSKTLKAIEDFKTKNPGSDKVNAHLTVLQGMIHLQSGRYGQARAMRDDVAAAAAQLRQEGRHTRDELFALAFDPLVRGWTDARGPRTNNNDMRRAGDEIATLLRGFATGSDQDTDEGALYLAATAAAFRTPYILNADPDDGKALAADSMQLIGRYLTPDETAAARAENYAAIAPGHVRYARWYRTMWDEAGRPAA